MKRTIRMAATAVACLSALLIGEDDARAWYFPEHAEITRIALERYSPPAVARAIQRAVSAARAVGLPLCEPVSIPFLSIPMQGAFGTPVAACIPYTSLPALAGDHANSALNLQQLLVDTVSRWPFHRQTVAAMVVGTAVSEFTTFRNSTPAFFQRVYVDAPNPGSNFSSLADLDLDGRRFTRDLDARLQLVDSDYSSRAAGSKAHFQNAEEPMQAVLDALVRVGDADNALAQMVAHHARSLQLALRARNKLGPSGDRLRAEALLEHSFALHFLEDAFAAGHIGTEPAINKPIERLQRHDYLNRTGLGATRALAERRCEPVVASGEMPICWTAYGDGYMNSDNMPLVAEAVARAQLQFAMALEPQLVEQMREDTRCADVSTLTIDWSSAPPFASEFADDQCDLSRAAALLDPAPSWTMTTLDRSRRMTWGLVVAIVTGARDAMQGTDDAPSALITQSLLAPASCGVADGGEPGVLTREILGQPLDPCVEVEAAPIVGSTNPIRLRSEQACPGRVDWRTSSIRSRALRWSAVDVSLWRPLLVAWPTAQADIRTIRGRDSFGYGFAYTAGYGAGAMVAPTQSQVPSAIGVGFEGGIGYRSDSVLPGRENRAIAEINAGLSIAELNAVPGTRLALVGMAEFRMPLISLLSWGAAGWLTKSSNVMGVLSKNWGIGVFGVRGYLIVPGVIPRIGPPEGRFLGGDLEVFYVSLGHADTVQEASAGVDVDPELRVRLGLMRLGAAAQEGPIGSYGLAISLELARGYSWFF
jgi:hypothetical protein